MMIFFKNRGDILSHNIDILLRFHFHIHKQYMTSPFVGIGAPGMKRLFSELKTGKIIPRFMIKQILLSSVHRVNRIFPWIRLETTSRYLPALYIPANRMSAVSLIQSVFNRVGNRGLNLNRASRSSLPASRAVFHPQAALNVLSPGGTSEHQLTNLGKHLPIVKNATRWMHDKFISGGRRYSTFAQKRKWGEHYSLLEQKAAAVLPQVTSLLNNESLININRESRFPTSKNWLTINKSLMNHYHPNSRTADFGPIGTTSFRSGTEDFFFKNQSRLENEIEELKKIINKTKESITGKNISTPSVDETTIKRTLDINRISDQVYRNIEQRIRVERERRGL